jgi:hypothetical protein
MQPTLNPSSQLAKKLQQKSFKGNIIIAVVSILILVLASITAYSKHLAKNFYVLNDSGTAYTYRPSKTNKKSVEFPTTHKGLPITEVGIWAYGESKKLEEVVISDNITRINDDAFSKCTSLTKVNIPSSVTSVGEDAFYKTAYYNTESNWDGNALYLDGWLIGVKGDEENPVAIDIKDGTIGIADKLFSERNDIKSVTIPDSVLYLGKETFRKCSFLESVEIGDGATSISSYSFYDCKRLSSVVIGEGVNKIGYYCFTGCINLVSVVFEDPDTWYYSAFADYTDSQQYYYANSKKDCATDLKGWLNTYFWYKK